MSFEPPHVDQRLTGLADVQGETTLGEVYEMMEDKSDAHVDFAKRFDLLSPWEVRQYVLAAGWYDTGATVNGFDGALDRMTFRRERCEL